MQNISVISPQKPVFFIEFHQGGSIISQPEEIAGNNFDRLEDIQAAAAIMVADARKKNWPSIRLQGEEDLKEFVFIEATLQGIKVDLKNSDGYQPSAWAIDQIGTRMQLAGQGNGIYGRDGTVNLEKAFGAMP